MQKKFKIEVDCANCAAKIEDAVKKLPGVNSASVSFMAQKMVLDVDDDKFDAVLKDVVKTAKRVEPADMCRRLEYLANKKAGPSAVQA